MQYEVRILDADGRTSAPFRIQCADIIEAHKLVQTEHDDAAVLLRAVRDESGLEAAV